MSETIGQRLKKLRESLGLSQNDIGKQVGVPQSAMYRFEHDIAQPNYRILCWYADYFDVSTDYLLLRTDKPQGKLYKHEPKSLKEKLSKQKDMAEFVEALFDPKSLLNSKFKEMLMQSMENGEV